MKKKIEKVVTIACVVFIFGAIFWVYGGVVRAKMEVNAHNRRAYEKHHETHYLATLKCSNCGIRSGDGVFTTKIEMWVPNGEKLADQPCPRCKQPLGD